MRISILFILAVISINSMAQGNDPLRSDTLEQAKLIVYRESNEYGRYIPFNLFVDGRQIALLKNAMRLVYFVSEGEHDISAESGELGKSMIHSVFLKGKIYYVRVNAIEGEKYPLPDIRLVDKSEGERYLEDHYMKDGGVSNPLIDSLAKIRAQMYWRGMNVFRVGVDMGMGGGFKHFALFENTNGNYVYLSPGGGIHFGLETGYTFDTHYDISASATVCMSSLSQTLQNASAYFIRLVLNATGKYCIPFGKMMRVNLGGGIGRYAGGTMDVDASQLSNGSHEVYYYKGALGFHGLAEWEFFMKAFSMSFGMKYYNVYYDLNFITVNGTQVPQSYYTLGNMPQILAERSHIDGSGIDVYWKIAYHF